MYICLVFVAISDKSEWSSFNGVLLNGIADLFFFLVSLNTSCMFHILVCQHVSVCWHWTNPVIVCACSTAQVQVFLKYWRYAGKYSAGLRGSRHCSTCGWAASGEVSNTVCAFLPPFCCLYLDTALAEIRSVGWFPSFSCGVCEHDVLRSGTVKCTL